MSSFASLPDELDVDGIVGSSQTEADGPAPSLAPTHSEFVPAYELARWGDLASTESYCMGESSNCAAPEHQKPHRLSAKRAPPGIEMEIDAAIWRAAATLAAEAALEGRLEPEEPAPALDTKAEVEA